MFKPSFTLRARSSRRNLAKYSRSFFYEEKTPRVKNFVKNSGASQAESVTKRIARTGFAVALRLSVESKLNGDPCPARVINPVPEVYAD